MSEDDFIDAIAARFIVEGMDDDEYTRQYARDVLTASEIVFGHPDYSWTIEDARSIAESDISYWGD